MPMFTSKLKIFIVLAILQQKAVCMDDNVSKFLGAFVKNTNPKQFHVGMYGGQGSTSSGLTFPPFLSIVLCNTDKAYGTNEYEQARELYNDLEFELRPRDNCYHVCIQDFVVASIAKESIKAVMLRDSLLGDVRIFFNYLLEGDQLNTFRKNYYKPLHEKHRQVTVCFGMGTAELNDRTNTIKLPKQSGNQRRFAVNYPTPENIKKVLAENYNILGKPQEENRSSVKQEVAAQKDPVITKNQDSSSLKKNNNISRFFVVSARTIAGSLLLVLITFLMVNKYYGSYKIV